MRAILVPTDFSKAAENALNYAAALAQKTNAPLILMHSYGKILEPVPVDPYIYEKIDEEEYLKEADSKVKATVGSLKEKWGLSNIQSVFSENDLSMSINNILIDNDVDLVVIGTHGADSFMERMGWTNTGDIIRHTPCPVLIIPEAANNVNFQKVAFATTMKDDQFHAFEWLSQLQKLMSFKLDIVYLNNPSHFLNEEDFVKKVNLYSKRSGLDVSGTYSDFYTDDEVESISAFVKEDKADLLVMVSHRRKGLARLVFGSVTEATVYESKIPVLVLGTAAYV